MDARDALLRILFVRILFTREKTILSLVNEESKTIAFDELIFPNLKPLNISLPIGNEFHWVTIQSPERRANSLAKPEKKNRGTICREWKHVHCAINGCQEKTNWLAEFYGRGNKFQVISSKDGTDWTPVCATHAEWAKTARGVKILQFWEVVTAYLTDIWNNYQPTAKRPSKKEMDDSAPGQSVVEPTPKAHIQISDLVAGFIDLLELLQIIEELPDDDYFYGDAYTNYNRLMRKNQLMRKEEA